jgi:plasmid stabilization system protein ParE
LSQRRVRFTATAQGHVRREKLWWLENRTHTEVFSSELEEAIRILAFLPGAGTPYPEAGVAGLRRIYLRKVACHIYYTFDEQEVIVRAFWGARRGRGPFTNP